MSETTYLTVLDGIYKKYGPKAIDLLCQVRDVCREAGLVTDGEPTDISADEYRWTLRVWRRGFTDIDNCIDVSVEIGEAGAYDSEESYGITFALNIVEYGGRILGGLTPYNYTNLCWVDSRDADAVAERWKDLAEADISEIPYLIER